MKFQSVLHNILHYITIYKYKFPTVAVQILSRVIVNIQCHPKPNKHYFRYLRIIQPDQYFSLIKIPIISSPKTLNTKGDPRRRPMQQIRASRFEAEGFNYTMKKTCSRVQEALSLSLSL